MKKMFSSPVIIGVKVEKKTKEKLLRLARKHNKRLSDILREIIEAYLEEEG